MIDNNLLQPSGNGQNLVHPVASLIIGQGLLQGFTEQGQPGLQIRLANTQWKMLANHVDFRRLLQAAPHGHPPEISNASKVLIEIIQLLKKMPQLGVIDQLIVKRAYDNFDFFIRGRIRRWFHIYLTFEYGYIVKYFQLTCVHRMNLWQQLSEQISQHTQTDFEITSNTAMGGGCINQACRISNGETHYFVKLNGLEHGDMFEVEALSLQALAQSNTLRVPHPICHGQTHRQAWLVLEYLELNGRADAVALGRQLAAMHRVQAPQFGWHRDNTIGSTPQSNQQHSDWIEFWRHQRLIPQLQLAQKNGYGAALSIISERLLDDFDSLFDGYQPTPSMLHGDLWGGNVAGLTDGTPVIFDPAFYYGDREADIAMTYLFGGFSGDFYAAYNEAWPLDQGFAQRKTFYNLYHIINHLNLFGGGYLGQAISMAERIIAEL